MFKTLIRIIAAASLLVSAIITAAPWSASFNAMARPIPLAPPVTTAT